MIAKARARFSSGALHLLEPLDLTEGQVVLVSVEDGSPPDPVSDSVLDMFERLHQAAPPGTWDSLPADGAKNIDYYLYGAPKQEE